MYTSNIENDCSSNAGCIKNCLINLKSMTDYFILFMFAYICTILKKPVTIPLLFFHGIIYKWWVGWMYFFAFTTYFSFILSHQRVSKKKCRSWCGAYHEKRCKQKNLCDNRVHCWWWWWWRRTSEQRTKVRDIAWKKQILDERSLLFFLLTTKKLLLFSFLLNVAVRLCRCTLIFQLAIWFEFQLFLPHAAFALYTLHIHPNGGNRKERNECDDSRLYWIIIFFAVK